jgi:hypothetical protein
MCKQEEIDALTAFTESFPHDSYLRPWLEDVLPQMRADIRNDFPVSPSLTITRHECRKLTEAANIQAQATIAKAVREAADLERNAQRERQHWRDHFANELQTCLKKLGYGC